MGRTVTFVFGASWLLVQCALEVVPEYARPTLGQIDAASGAWWLPDGLDEGVDAVPPGFGIVAVFPTSGVPEGGDKVILEGHDFRQTDRVFFDEVEAVEARFQGPERLVAFTPVHASGRAVVRVRRQEGEETVAPRGFLFTREPALLEVSPRRVDVGGGQPVTLRFASLDADALLLVGTRQLAGARRIDDHTVVGVLPPLPGGLVDLLVVTPGKTYTFEDALEAVATPAIERAEPMGISAAGGGIVALVGRGLTGDARVFVEGEPVDAPWARADGTRLGVRVPAGASGPLRVEVVAEGGYAEAVGVVVRTEGATPALAGVFPASGDQAGGEVLTLALVALEPALVERVQVGGHEAAILSRPPSGLLVAAPALPVGVHDVEIEAEGLVLSAEAAYQARAEAFRVEALSPAEGPVGGGTRVTLSGSLPAELEGASLCGLPLAGLEAGTGGVWSGVTPGASSGECVLHVAIGGREVATGATFRFLAGSTRLLAVARDEGSRAGDTLVQLLGTDLPAAPRVYFGEREARVVLAEAHVVTVRAPAVDHPGPVDVAVTDGAHAATLGEAYAYVDLATETTGTWGGPVRGAVNVTVLHTSTREAVPDAHVALKLVDGHYLRRTTDAKGQTVFSEAGLAGPVEVTASKAGFSAYTIAGFDARNATLGVWAPVPVTPSDGDPIVEPLFKPATVTGRALGVDKYVPPPFRSCEPVEDDGVCTPCEDDTDCPGVLRCARFGEFGAACLVPCSPFDDPCPARYGCYPGPDDSALCHPVLGQRRTYCFASADGPGGAPVTRDQGALVSADDTFFLANVRLGEIAILCLAGYEDDVSAAFVPQTLGAARHLFTMSDTLLEGVDVFLDTPLSESPPFELTGYVDRPGAFPALNAQITLDLGSDGALTLPDEGRFVDARHVIFPRVPLRFEGTLYDASFALEIHAARGGTAYAPYAEAYRFGLEGFHQGRTYEFEQGVPVERTLSLPLNFTALASTAAGDMLAATDDGRLLRHRWGTWYAEPVVGRVVLRALATSGDRVLAVGDDGVLLQGHVGAWESPVTVTDRALRGVALLPSGEVVTVGEQRLLEGPVGALVLSKIPDHLRAASASSSGDAWAVGAGGVVYHRALGDWRRFVLDPHDDLVAVAAVDGGAWVAGSAGSVRFVRADGSAEALVDLGAPIGALVATGPGVLVGHLGGVAAFDGAAWTRTPLAPDFLVTGVVAEGLAPTLAVGALRLALGPVLPPPTFLRPEPQGTWSSRTLAWQFPIDDVPGDYQLVTLFDYFGGQVWTVLLSGRPTSHALAPLDAWGEYDPVARPALRLQYSRVLADGFDLDQTNGYASSYLTRDAVLYDYFEFLRR